MRKEQFSLRHHVPHYSRLLLGAIFTPLPLYIALAGNTLMFLGAGLFLHFERGVNPNVTGYFDAVWWAMCTVSTVGFGDIVPITTGGRLVAMGLIASGVLFFVSFTASIATTVISMTTEDVEKKEDVILREVRELKGLLGSGSRPAKDT